MVANVVASDRTSRAYLRRSWTCYHGSPRIYIEDPNLTYVFATYSHYYLCLSLVLNAIAIVAIKDY